MRITGRILIILFFLLGFVQCQKNPGKGIDRPNILFIAIDDLRPELGSYGHSYVKSPHIDQLASEGVIFTRAYCQTALCNPSRTSLMTGLYPKNNGVWENRAQFRNTLPEIITLPQYFKQNGYQSVAIGKIYHNIFPDTLSWSEPKLYLEGFPFDPDAVYADPENLKLLEDKKARIIKEGKQDRRIDRFGQWYLKAVATEGPDVPDDAYYDGAQVKVAINKLAELGKQEKLFFFAVGFYKPHLPFNAPKRYWDLYERDSIPLAENPFLPSGAPSMASSGNGEVRSYSDFRDIPSPFEGTLTESQMRLLKHGYVACVSYVDKQVGELLYALDSLGLKENTIIVLWGDHGWKLGEHNAWAKQTNYEIDMRVPLIIRTPWNEKQRSTNQIVELVDLYPTLCDLAGLEIPPDLDGTSIVPLLFNPEIPIKNAAYSLLERRKNKFNGLDYDYLGYSVRTDRYRYVEWMNLITHEIGARELYDQKLDPQENINLSDDSRYQEALVKLSVMLKPGWQQIKSKLH